MSLLHLELATFHYNVDVSLELYLSPLIPRQHKGVFFMDGSRVHSTNNRERKKFFLHGQINKNENVCVGGLSYKTVKD